MSFQPVHQQIPHSTPKTKTPIATSNIKQDDVLVSASKEWVIPARPKPGRKPILDPPPTKRKAQNRAAQRAFRERKAEYIQELEEKVRQFEQNGMDNNVQLQQTSRRLYQENQFLRERIIQLEQQLQKFKQDQQHHLNKLNSGNMSKSSKRKRSTSMVVAQMDNSKVTSHPISSLSSLSSLSSPTPTQLSIFSQEKNLSKPMESTPKNPYLELTKFDDTVNNEILQDGCGFCSNDTICVCKAVGIDPSPLPSVETNEKLQELNISSQISLQSQSSVGSQVQPSSTSQSMIRPYVSLSNSNQNSPIHTQVSPQIASTSTSTSTSTSAPPNFIPKSLQTPLCQSCISNPNITQLYRLRGAYYAPTYACMHCQTIQSTNNTPSSIPPVVTEGSVVLLPLDGNWDIATEDHPQQQSQVITSEQDHSHQHQFKVTSRGTLILDTGDDIVQFKEF